MSDDITPGTPHSEQLAETLAPLRVRATGDLFEYQACTGNYECVEGGYSGPGYTSPAALIADHGDVDVEAR